MVLTFDDGPWPVNTPSVLKTLADECTTGIFFSIGKHATYYPEILKQVYAAGHTVGSHTWSHATLTNKKLTDDQKKEEIEKGFSAVKWALGGVSPSPFFRFPALQHPPEMVTYLGERNIAMFSCDLDSFDFKASKAQQVIDVTMKKLDKLGKGIILMHDFHKHTAEALPELLKRLKAGGYKVVAMKAKAPVQTLPQYDDEVLKDAKLPTVSSRPVSSGSHESGAIIFASLDVSPASGEFPRVPQAWLFRLRAGAGPAGWPIRKIRAVQDRPAIGVSSGRARALRRRAPGHFDCDAPALWRAYSAEV